MTPDKETIKKRAYEIWEKEGRPHGRDMEHWDQAAREAAAMNGGAAVARATNGGLAESLKKAPVKKTAAKAVVPPPTPAPAIKRSRPKTPSK